VVDGIKNHLWKAIKTAVSGWFNDKVEEVTGFGKAIFNLLRKGGINLAKVGKMVWQAIVSGIPGMIVSLLVEKLVAMIVPAAGAVLAVMQGLQAAWGSVQRVITAISSFVTFLKAVKTGKSGPQFAAALAAGAVAVIEFIAQWLLKKLKGAASAVGGRLRAIAKRIGERLKAIGKAVVGGAKKAAGAVVRGVKAVGRGIVKGAKAVGRGIAKGARWLEKRTGRIGAVVGRGVRAASGAVKRGWQKVQTKVKEWRDKFKKWREERKTKAAKGKEERQGKARDATAARLRDLVDRGVSGLRLRAELLYLKVRHRWRTLRLVKKGETFQILGGFSPEEQLLAGAVNFAVREIVTTSGEVKPDVEVRDDIGLAVGTGPAVDPVVAAGAARATTGEEYEGAINPYVLGSLGPAMYGENVERTLPRGRGGFDPSHNRGRRSSQETVRLHPQKGMRGGPLERRPDVRAERIGPGGRLEAFDWFEITLNSDWTGSDNFDKSKRSQIAGNTFILRQRLEAEAARHGGRAQAVTVNVNIISRSNPSEGTRELLFTQFGTELEKLSAAVPKPTIRIYWRIIGA
jgi:hypothetical protein